MMAGIVQPAGHDGANGGILGAETRSCNHGSAGERGDDFSRLPFPEQAFSAVVRKPRRVACCVVIGLFAVIVWTLGLLFGAVAAV